MKVSSRIGGSFLLLCLLTLALGYASWNSISLIHDQVDITTQQTEPMVRDSGILVSELRVAHNLALQFLVSRDDIMRAEQAQAFVQQADVFKTHWQNMNQKYSQINLFSSLLEPVKSTVDDFFSFGLSVKNLHDKNLKLEKKVSIKAVDFSYLRGEILSSLNGIKNESEDYTSVFSAEQFVSEANYTMTLLESLPNLISEKEIARTLKDIDQQNQKHQSQMISFRKSEDSTVEDYLPVIDDFMGIMNSVNGLVFQYREMQSNQIRIDQQMTEMNASVFQASAQLSELVSLANKLSAQSSAEAERILEMSTRIIVSMVIIVMLVSMVVGLWVTTSIARPLKRIGVTLNAVAAGDLTQQLIIQGKDEFSQLSQEINTLVNRLSELMEQVQQGADRLAVTANKTLNISTKTTLNIDEQRGMATQASSVLSQMTTSAGDVAEKAEQTRQAVIAVNDNIQAGNQLMDASIESVEQLAGSINTSSIVVNNVQEQSTRIGSVLQVIRDISEQTNLLALNAAIEAARAGDMGRGFAVVADEIRSLASRTYGSTEEIQDIIEKLQHQAQEAVTRMKVSSDEAQRCISQYAQLQQSMGGVTHSIGEIRVMNTQIASSVDQQQDAVKGVSTMTARMEYFATQTLDGASKTETFSRELNGIAEQQRKLIAWFSL